MREQEWLTRYARHYLATATRLRKAGDILRARQCLENAKAALSAAEREANAQPIHPAE